MSLDHIDGRGLVRVATGAAQKRQFGGKFGFVIEGSHDLPDSRARVGSVREAGSVKRVWYCHLASIKWGVAVQRDGAGVGTGRLHRRMNAHCFIWGCQSPSANGWLRLALERMDRASSSAP